MKTYNDNFKDNNGINWEYCKEFGANFIGGNAYDYAVIVRKNGARLMCSDAETWAENTKGLRMASVAYVVMWCAYEYTDAQREEAKANGETLTRGVSSVVDFTRNEQGYADFLDEVTVNNSNTEIEYFNGTTGAVEKCNGIADTVAEDYAQKTGKSEQYKQFAEAQKLNYAATIKAARKADRLMHKYTETLSTEDRTEWFEAVEERQRLEEIGRRYTLQWYEVHDLWDARHMPAIEAFVARQKAREAEQTTEAVETAPESEKDREQDNTPTNGGQTATETENEPQADNTANGSRLANAKAYAAAAWSWFIGWLVGGASLLACVLVPVVAWLVVQSLAEVPHEFTGGDWFALIGGGSLCLVGMPCGCFIFREIYKFNTWAWSLSHARG